MSGHITGEQVFAGLHGERKSARLAGIKLGHLAKRLGLCLIQSVFVIEIGKRRSGVLDGEYEHFVDGLLGIIFNLERDWASLYRVLINRDAHVRI